MVENKPRKKNLKTSEEIELARIRAKRRFKAITWLVIANLCWLQEDTAEKLGENVRQNVKFLLKKKKDTLLNFYEKTLLMKAAVGRTDEEKQHIYKVIGGLKCFKNYPENVKRQLAGVTYFQFYNAGRTIVKQGRPGHALYFIMSGEVNVNITSFDPILKEMKTVTVGSMVTGQMFGEVSLLHDIPRTATIVTKTDVECLLLYKEDFKEILHHSLLALWNKIIASLKKWDYFTKWNNIQQRECCIYAKIKTFKKNDVIFGMKKHKNMVHFILKGKCKLIEKMYVAEMKYMGKKTYKLFDKDLYDKEMEMLRNASIKSNIGLKASASATSRKLYNYSGRNMNDVIKKRKEKLQDMTINYEDYYDYLAKDCLPDDVNVVYMEICTFMELACFGVGEYMKNRYILAESEEVECLLIPRIWLHLQDKENMWPKVIQVLNTEIPNNIEVFQLFVQKRRWGAENIKLVNKLRRKPPCNHIRNIPHSIRLKETIDYGVRYK